MDMRLNYVIMTALFILIGSGSLFFGLASCQSVNKAKSKDVQVNKDNTAASVPSGQRSSIASLLISEVESEKGIQNTLTKESHQILEIWAVVKTMNSVINILQSAQARSSFFAEALVNPLDSLSPIDSVFNKISGMLLGAYSTVVFQKVLLSLSAFIIFILIIPICALVTIILIWTNKDKTKFYRIAIASALINLIIIFAIPISINTSSLLGNKILAKNINTLAASIIEEKGKTASAMEDDIIRSRRTGNSIINYMGRVKTLSNTLAEEVINYYIIFLLVFIVIPVLTLILIFFLTRYCVRLFLNKK
jgi:hypothetical protein